jgi:Asp-tRNA(Asn)/Glu-tRNA(Gln) amidotransferase A subunit family amidase
MHYKSIGELSEQYRERRISPVELIERCIDRIENAAFANYYGLPAISLPCGRDSHGLPIGLQIVGRSGDEQLVLSVAHHYQAASGVWNRPPP